MEPWLDSSVGLYRRQRRLKAADRLCGARGVWKTASSRLFGS